MNQPTLEELCAGYDEHPPRMEYVNYERTITTVGDPAVLIVNLRLVAAALRGDPIWATLKGERTPETFKPDRYNRAMATIQAEKPIYMPWLSFKHGRLRVTDGRHRLYALMDEGYTHAKVVSDPWHAVMIRTLVDEDDGGPSDSGYAEYMTQVTGKLR